MSHLQDQPSIIKLLSVALSRTRQGDGDSAGKIQSLTKIPIVHSVIYLVKIELEKN